MTESSRIARPGLSPSGAPRHQEKPTARQPEFSRRAARPAPLQFSIDALYWRSRWMEAHIRTSQLAVDGTEIAASSRAGLRTAVLAMAAVLLSACGDHAKLPETAGMGPHPKLPSPTETLFPTLKIA